ncbi:hypothetical protein L6452_32130 [Arctium lappa]|uniref:Uncharacterized protein n=1 Tax=Arctium lappa TaxID=4217 RepID=A0ACB8Z3P8_ARCLA|nr:hypothetical protein L6452_32130 [Arctium lappa]
MQVSKSWKLICFGFSKLDENGMQFVCSPEDFDDFCLRASELAAESNGAPLFTVTEARHSSGSSRSQEVDSFDAAARKEKMRRRSRRKSSAADLLITPPSSVATPNRSLTESPKIFKCSSTCFNTPTNSSSSVNEDSRSSNHNSSKKPAAESPTSPSPAPAMLSLNKAHSRIADLKEMASSRIDSIKRKIDCSYIDILKDMEASHSRLHKRYKVQNQSCEQSMNEAEKDFEKMIDHLRETHDTMEASYMDLIAEAQARATRLCKTTFPELSQSVEKAIDELRNRYGAASA